MNMAKFTKFAVLSAVLATDFAFAQDNSASKLDEAIGVTVADTALRPGQPVALSIRGADCTAEGIIDHRLDWADGSWIWTVQTLSLTCESRQARRAVFEVSRDIRGGVVAGVLQRGTVIPLGIPRASLR